MDIFIFPVYISISLCVCGFRIRIRRYWTQIYISIPHNHAHFNKIEDGFDLRFIVTGTKLLGSAMMDFL